MIIKQSGRQALKPCSLSKIGPLFSFYTKSLLQKYASQQAAILANISSRIGMLQFKWLKLANQISWCLQAPQTQTFGTSYTDRYSETFVDFWSVRIPTLHYHYLRIVFYITDILYYSIAYLEIQWRLERSTWFFKTMQSYFHPNFTPTG